MLPLPAIRPISDLRTDLNGVCEDACETQQPIFMTKNGKATLVVMDCEAYERQRQHDRYVMKTVSYTHLIPSDPADDKDIIVEIRAAAGGDEAAASCDVGNTCTCMPARDSASPAWRAVSYTHLDVYKRQPRAQNVK